MPTADGPVSAVTTVLWQHCDDGTVTTACVVTVMSTWVLPNVKDDDPVITVLWRHCDDGIVTTVL